MARLILSAFADEASQSLAGQIAALTRNQVTRLEIRGMNGRAFVDHTPDEAREVQKQLADAGIKVSALGSPFGKMDIEAPFGPHLDHFKRALALCDVMGTDRMRVFSFFMPKGKDPADFRGEVIDRMGTMLEAARDAGVRCAHENEKGIYGDITERCLDLLTVFDGQLGGIFDPANFIQCGVGPLVACEALKSRVHWMHVKDAIMANGRVVPAGNGDGHIAEVLTAIAAQVNGDLILTLEPHLKVFSGLSGLEREGEETNIDNFTYQSNDDAFDAAVSAIKDVMAALSYKEIVEGGTRTWQK